MCFDVSLEGFDIYLASLLDEQSPRLTIPAMYHRHRPSSKNFDWSFISRPNHISLTQQASHSGHSRQRIAKSWEHSSLVNLSLSCQRIVSLLCQLVTSNY
jgi:hypothetical protein